MCGIAGIISQKPFPDNYIHGITEALLHRGPNAKGIFFNEQHTVGLGHTRLSIIDLSSDANQPMHSSDDRFVIVFNGEVYNFQSLKKELEQYYSFRTNSDTEVILQAYAKWGNDMVQKLDGMFALAIYDKLENTLFVCRDRMGKKPLFYYQDTEHFIFGSEIKSLLKHPAVKANCRINRQSIFTFLHLGYIPSPDTVYDTILKFPKGHTGIVKAGMPIALSPYWNETSFAHPSDNISVGEAKLELKKRLTDAVAKRLISDVPIGTFLSGGTDSSLITALASKQVSGKLKTFSIGFSESKFNETAYAKAVAKELGTEYVEYILSEQEAIAILDTYLHHFDEPFADTSAIPTMLVSKLARKEVTVALTGDGGDELFLGYGSYDWANRLSSGLFHRMGPVIATGLSHLGSDRLKRASHLFERVTPGQLRSHIFSQEQYFFSNEEIQELLIDDKSYRSFSYSESRKNNLNPAELQALFDLKYYLPDDLLVKVDRASMYHALECRCPLLDHHVVEYALQLPYEFKKRGDVKKWILKELLSEYLPPSLVHRPKWGFSIPLAAWLKRDLKFMIDTYLSKSSVEALALFKYEKVNQLIHSFFKGSDHLYHRIWTLVILHKWMKENG